MLAHRRDDGAEIRGRRRRRDAWPQLADEDASERTLRACRPAERQPELRSAVELESVGHDTDDGIAARGRAAEGVAEALRLEADCAAEHRAVAGEILLPHAVAQDDDVRAGCFVGRREESAGTRPDTEHLEERR